MAASFYAELQACNFFKKWTFSRFEILFTPFFQNPSFHMLSFFQEHRRVTG